MNRKFNLSEDTETRTIIIQFIKFGLVGISNTLVSWLCYYIFILVNSALYLIGGTVGGIISIANAFFWNEHFVFKCEKKDLKSKIKRLGKTYVSYGVTSLLGLLILWVEVKFWEIDEKLAPIINLIITVPLNFIINKLWTFKDKEKAP